VLAGFIKREFPILSARREFEKFLKRRYGIPIGKPFRMVSGERYRYYRGIGLRIVQNLSR